jgi:ATP-dependent RNA helicase RhlE
MFAAQTGTGKTLSYVLPVIHQLKQSELEAETVLTQECRPRALILVPNRELAMQVLNDGLKPFHYQVPLKFFSMYSGQSHKIET